MSERLRMYREVGSLAMPSLRARTRALPYSCTYPVWKDAQGVRHFSRSVSNELVGKRHVEQADFVWRVLPLFSHDLESEETFEGWFRSSGCAHLNIGSRTWRSIWAPVPGSIKCQHLH